MLAVSQPCTPPSTVAGDGAHFEHSFTLLLAVPFYHNYRLQQARKLLANLLLSLVFPSSAFKADE